MDEMSSSDTAMLRAYVEFAQRFWSDEGFAGRAMGEPRAALVESGWEIPEGTEVELAAVEAGEQDPTSPDPAALVAGWREGIEAGKLSVLVPSEPVAAEPGTISDEELANVSGGNACLGHNPEPPDLSKVCYINPLT
jgi:bacteriocin-like protein